MSQITEMRDKVRAYLKTAKSILDTATGENRNLTAAEQRDIDGLYEKVDGLNQTIKRYDSVRDRLEDLENNPMRSPGEGLVGSRARLQDGEFRTLTSEEKFSDFIRSRGMGDEQQLSAGKAVRGMLLGDWKGAEAEQRSMSQATGGLGGWLVSPALSGTIIDLARAKSACINAGARTLPMEEPEITVVKITSDPRAYWRPEHGAITESDMGFAPVKLKAVALGCLTRVSLELLEDARAFSNTVEQAISSALALELDRAALLGSGVGEPRGIWSTEGVNVYSMGTNGAALSNFDPFSYAVESVANYNGTAGAVVYSPRTAGAIDRLKDKQDQPLTAPESFRGLKKLTTSQIPNDQTQGTCTAASCSFVGDFAQLLIGIRTQLVLEATRIGGNDTFAKMEALIRGYLRADVAVLRPNHFTLVKGIKQA